MSKLHYMLPIGCIMRVLKLNATILLHIIVINFVRQTDAFLNKLIKEGMLEFKA